MSAEEESNQAVTRKDLTDFRSFLLDQLKVHTSELSSKFDKAMNALLVTKQLKAESELKFTHPGNERNYKFNLEIIDVLETASKSLHEQDTAKAVQLISRLLHSKRETERIGSPIPPKAVG